MTVRIASTTDTPEQVTAALGKEAPKKESEKKEPAAPAVEAEKKDVDAPAQESTTETTTEVQTIDGSEQEGKEGIPSPKKKGGFQKKIDKLTRRAQEAELENAHLKRMLQEGPKPTEVKKEPAVAMSDAGKPTPEKFDTHAEYIEALSDWKVDQKLAAVRKKDDDAKDLAVRGEKVKAWNQRLDAGRAAHEDFDEALAADVPVSPAMMEVMLDSELGAEIAYHLGKNPEDAKRIAQLSPTATARELGKIEARLEKPKEESAPVKGAIASVKPKPVAPVAGRATPTASKKPEDMTYQEFKKWRQTQLAEQARS